MGTDSGSSIPSWVLGGEPSTDIDFANTRAWQNATSYSTNDTIKALFSTWSTPAHYATDTNGLLWAITANTLDSSVITAGLCKGQLLEVTRTNVVLQNRDLTNAAWTKSNTTAAKDQTGADGTANGASKLTATADNGTALQAITLASSARFQTAYVKRITGTGTIQMTTDNGSTWTTITTTASWTRQSIPTQTLANPTVGFKIATSGDAIAVDFVQNENGTFATSPIVVVGTAVARASTSLISTNGGALCTNAQSAKSTYAQTTGIAAAAFANVWKLADGARLYMTATDYGLEGFSWSEFIALTTYANTVKWAGSMDASGISLTATDRAIEVGTDPYDGNTGNLYIGNTEASAQYLNGYLTRVTFWPQRFSSSVLSGLVA